jgi:methylmalonyl-CoA mutase
MALPFDVECGFPTELARRMARNTHLLLAEESHVGAVIDPAGGAFYPEALTEMYAGRAWELFGEMDAAGGPAAGLLDGSIASLLASTWTERRRNVARRKDPITGVSEFPFLGEAHVEAQQPDRGAVRAAVLADDRVAGVADHLTAEAPTTCEALPEHRFAEEFEALRDASDAHLERTGARPKVFLASLGPVAKHTARTTWARNFFEAGGIEAVVTDGYPDAPQAAEAFTASGATIACLCSSDDVYEALVDEVAPALTKAGATHLYLAGNPGERSDADVAAGIGTFVHVGVDAIDVLNDAQQILGVTR